MHKSSPFLSAWDQKQANVRFDWFSTQLVVAAWQVLQLARLMQTMVVTWMLQTKLDHKAMDSKLQLLNDDVRTV